MAGEGGMRSLASTASFGVCIAAICALAWYAGLVGSRVSLIDREGIVEALERVGNGVNNGRNVDATVEAIARAIVADPSATRRVYETLVTEGTDRLAVPGAIVLGAAAKLGTDRAVEMVELIAEDRRSLSVRETVLEMVVPDAGAVDRIRDVLIRMSRDPTEDMRMRARAMQLGLSVYSGDGDVIGAACGFAEDASVDADARVVVIKFLSGVSSEKWPEVVEKVGSTLKNDPDERIRVAWAAVEAKNRR